MKLGVFVTLICLIQNSFGNVLTREDALDSAREMAQIVNEIAGYSYSRNSNPRRFTRSSTRYSNFEYGNNQDLCDIQYEERKYARRRGDSAFIDKVYVNSFSFADIDHSSITYDSFQPVRGYTLYRVKFKTKGLEDKIDKLFKSSNTGDYYYPPLPYLKKDNYIMIIFGNLERDAIRLINLSKDLTRYCERQL
jgi:hypothetical protein